VEHPDVVFGNSIHDAAMLSSAGHAVAIHPSTELRAYAKQESWTIHMPAPQSAM
jgi:phosphoserine phosphatase